MPVQVFYAPKTSNFQLKTEFFWVKIKQAHLSWFLDLFCFTGKQVGLS